MGNVQYNYGVKYSLVTFVVMVNVPILQQSVRQDYFRMYYNIINHSIREPQPVVRNNTVLCLFRIDSD